MGDFDPHQFAAVALLQRRYECVGFQRDGMRHQPRSRRKQGPKGIEHGGLEAPADEDGVRCLKSLESSGRGSFNDGDPVGQAEGRGIPGDIRGTIAAGLDCDCRPAAQRPLDGN